MQNKRKYIKLVLIVACLVGVGVLLAVSLAKKSPTKQKYVNEEMGFSLYLPRDWSVDAVVAASGPDVLVASKETAFLRIRGFLDPDLSSPQVIADSLVAYKNGLSKQGVVISDWQIDTSSESLGEFSLEGEFFIGEESYQFSERGWLAITGRVLLVRMADKSESFSSSHPLLQETWDSFQWQVRSSAFKYANTAHAQASNVPLASLGNVNYHITDNHNRSRPAGENVRQWYSASLRGALLSKGISLEADGELLAEIEKQRALNNKLNSGQDDQHLLTDSQGDAFWGYKKYQSNLPQPIFRLEADVSIIYKDTAGDKQDLNVTLRIYDQKTGQLLKTAAAYRNDALRYMNEEKVGPSPSWWERYISGYVREVTFEDSLRSVISEASLETADALSSLGGQGFMSDADRFAQSLSESGYRPLVPVSVSKSNSTSDDEVDMIDIFCRGKFEPYPQDYCPYIFIVPEPGYDVFEPGSQICFNSPQEFHEYAGISSEDCPESD